MVRHTSKISVKKRILVGTAPGPGEEPLAVIPSREEKMQSISSSVHSLESERKSDNLFIYGKSGSGKTTYINHLLSMLREKNSIVPVYINCHEHQSKMAIFNKIASEMDNSFSRRGFASYEVFERIKEMIKKENKSVLLVLDDLAGLTQNEACDILYPIIEGNGGLRGSFAVIAISDDFRIFELLDPKIKSLLMFRVLEFEHYSKTELISVLKAVANRALAEEGCEEEVIDKIAEIAESGEGNARFAIWLLFVSAKNAEQRNADIIEMEDLQTVYETLLSLPSETGESDLSREELLIMDILKIGEKTSTEIYNIFLKKLKRSKRQIRKYLTSLIEKGYLEFEELKSPNQYLKPRIFRLKKR